MPGDEERGFLAAREELASALRWDSAQVFPLEQLMPLLATSLPPAARYLQLDAGRLVRCNAHGEPRNYLNTLSTALNILEKYGRNLLSPQRPRYWRSVKFNNPVFRSTVDAVQGGRDVLRLYGYTEERPDGLSFPEGQEEPDEYQVAVVTLEVLLLRTELSLLLQNTHPRQNALDQLLRESVEDGMLQLSEFHPLLREIVPGPRPSAQGSTPGPCFLCGSAPGTLHCPACNQVSCPACDILFHGHPSRAHHLRQALPGSHQTASLSSSLPASSQPRPPSSSLALGDSSLSSPDPANACLPWHCLTCATLNEPWAVFCAVCSQPKGCKVPGIEGSHGTGGLEPEPARDQWACQSCTFENEAAAVLCAICERPRLAQPPSLVVDSHDAGVCQQSLKQEDPLLTAAQPQVWYCDHCTFCNSGPVWVCAMCNRTRDPIPTQPALQSYPSSLEKGRPKPGSSQHLGSSLPASCGDPEKQRQDKMRKEGLQLVSMIQEGETAGASPEEVFSALQYSGTEVPLQWLRSELSYVLEMVAELAGQQDPELGAFSCQEARKAWLDRHGNLDEAVEECVRARRRKVHELQSLGFGPKEGSLQALFQHGGDVARALTELQRQRLEPFHQRLWDRDPEPTPCWDGLDRQSLVRRLLAVYTLPSWGRAELALALLQETPRNYELLDVVEAVRHSQDRAFLRRLLAQECAVCGWALPRNRMQALISCECTICPECFRQHFTIALKEKHITDMVCPACGRPDLTDDAQLLSYFSTLDIQLRESLDPDAYALFHKKLTEAVLMRDPKFLWCAQCSFGFIYEREQLEATCPQCHQTFCVRCKRQWEEQHRGRSCEDFQNWKRTNDPEYQAQGLAMYLQENGIDCPKCKFSYALARGGCMHFHCTQCRHQFCSGCYNAFYAKNKCPDPNCKVKKSLHGHHPRDCLFYLRDWTAARLQKLLQDNNVMFNTEPPAGTRAVPGGGCRVMEQKEVHSGFRDEACGKETPPGYAGLCQAHYKEYLVSLINAHSLDPATLYEVEELETATIRYLHLAPQPADGEDLPAYQARLLQKLREEVPLGQSIARRRK
ncbi:E3 ubiquitin-protein ligase RNF31 [Mus musculus]|uniref:E3 ubiquitin-protein ligase RNF31 n=1 Tax=Mus musculus TaxID=10090 RepID=RNF31_MOUSE|nr:E3 ubiquitin-protein ligase RNF31 [Mus musculus]Q924T7.2 RecName: Full=E3 ubiquitin-protein ligase RNF31; AltName: Full=HOIL-1-interacting protein; Short=HOIP; AltName: Full=Putative Ariadne-like ubiquitin ligase; Short=PAUL; AltName: Full=RING finger protein 31; AltName: Full=RING-type E3 ubiquitin transferase RNF31 [Mus musculus]AAH57595.1 Ring finger protein 31 [Mus musculus]EDL36276.1 ring finger protein 31, isoform CRA_b [Mus musculus]|eukprot:NP_919327.2 E3 ubiquitin-protein ligase RNF31 [Mus musculus]